MNFFLSEFGLLRNFNKFKQYIVLANYFAKTLKLFLRNQNLLIFISHLIFEISNFF